MQRGVLAAVCVLVIGVYACAARSRFVESVGVNAADSCYNLLVQSFRAGQLSLKKEVPPGFAQLADPYDPDANIAYRFAPFWMHDLSYYKGKLYLYFGVTPALILFWPFVALNGEYLPENQAVVIFCAMGFLASVSVLYGLWRRYFPSASVWVVAACALALGLATGMPVMLARPAVYEVSISCGYMLTMLALAAIWRALHEPPRHRMSGSGWLAAASLAYGLAVGARPNLLFGAVILLVPVVQAWRDRKPVWALLTAAVLPITMIGLGLMLYNELRFDHPLEFGLRYQLSNVRQDSLRFFSLPYLWFNFRIYFLAPARWGREFPFVQEIAVMVPAGRGPIESPVGILTTIPLVWLAPLGAGLAWRGRSESERSILRQFVAVVALAFGSCALVLCLFHGANFRYEVECLPAMVLLAVVGILGLERLLAPKAFGPGSPRSERGRPVWRRLARGGWGLLLGYSVAFNLLASVRQYAEACDDMGIALVRQHRFQEATEKFEQAVQLKPDFARAHLNLGIMLLQTGKVPDAISHLEQALRIAPDSAGAHNKLGAALIVVGRPHEALQHFEQALRIRPDLADAQNDCAWLLATVAPTEGGDPDRAVALAHRACELTGNRVPNYIDTLAVAYAAAGQFNDAIATSQKAIELARSAGETQLVSRIEMRLELYRKGQSYR